MNGNLDRRPVIRVMLLHMHYILIKRTVDHGEVAMRSDNVPCKKTKDQYFTFSRPMGQLKYLRVITTTQLIGQSLLK
jgi:hypothetical protein